MLRIPVFLDILTLEGEDTTFPRNFGFQLHSDAAPYPTSLEFSATMLQKPQRPKSVHREYLTFLIV